MSLPRVHPALPKEVQKALIDRDLSVGELAAGCGASRQAIYDVLQGKRHRSRLLSQLAGCLAMSPADLEEVTMRLRNKKLLKAMIDADLSVKDIAEGYGYRNAGPVYNVINGTSRRRTRGIEHYIAHRLGMTRDELFGPDSQAGPNGVSTAAGVHETMAAA